MPASVEFFRQFPARYFVETGTYRGQGVEMALAAGFAVIHSVELSEEHQTRNRRKFAANPNVHLYQGESAYHLGAILQSIDAPAVFWLDAHYSGGDTVKGPETSPLVKELNLIKQHRIKEHTILIDDRRHFGTIYFDSVTEDQARGIILSINPRYAFRHLTGSTEQAQFHNDVLVAVPESRANLSDRVMSDATEAELTCRP
jgi:hypothetical protein